MDSCLRSVYRGPDIRCWVTLTADHATKEFAETLFLQAWVERDNVGTYGIPSTPEMSPHKHVRTCLFCNAVYCIRQVKMFVALDV